MDREQRINNLVTQILSGDESLVYELWRELDDLCAWYCRKLLLQLPEAFKLEFGDLYNCGFIALNNALQHCSPEKVGKFSTYYLCYLAGTIYLENHLYAGGHYKDGRRRFDPIITGGTLSLDAPSDESQDKPEPLYDTLCVEQTIGTSDQALERIFHQQLHDVLERLVSMLPANQRYIIRQKYYSGSNCARIAECLKIKRSTVYALEDQALLTMKQNGQAMGLGQFLNDEIDYYSGTGLRQFVQSGSSSTERLALKRIDLEARVGRLQKQLHQSGH